MPFRPLHPCVLAASCMTLTACISPPYDPFGCSNAHPTRPDPVAEVYSEDWEHPHVVDFGDVSLGDTVERTVVIHSIGTDTLQIQELSVTSTAFEILDRDDVTRLLAPEERTEIRIRYTPRADESVDEDLIVGTSDRETPETTLQLRAEGLAPRLLLGPFDHDFGSVAPGCGDGLDVGIFNVGRAPLTLTGVDLQTTSTALDGVLPPSTVLAPNGEPAWVSLEYLPDLAGLEDSAVLTVRSDDPTLPVASGTYVGTSHVDGACP